MCEAVFIVIACAGVVIFSFRLGLKIGRAGLGLFLGLGIAIVHLAPAAAVAGPLGTYTVQPCRFLDTRQEIVVAPRGPIESFRALRLQGSCGVPLGARVAILNVTVTSSTSGGALGLCSSEQSAFPDGRPLACPPTVYFASGQTRAAMAMVQLYGVHEDDPEESDLLAVATLPAGSVHLIVDVIGYLR